MHIVRGENINAYFIGYGDEGENGASWSDEFRSIDSPRVDAKDKLTYDGSQLHSLFAYNLLRAKTDSIVSFIGPAKVSDHMVDQEDVLQKDFIVSKRMLHLIVTMTGEDLEKAVVYQRRMISIIKDTIQSFCDAVYGTNETILVQRGDDIYHDEKKMSVSIATKSANGKLLIHIGINVDVGKGCPVPAKGLVDLKIDEYSFAEIILRDIIAEVDSIRGATYKVSSVR